MYHFIFTKMGNIENPTILNILYPTLGENTERLKTIINSANQLLGNDPFRIEKAMDILFSNNWKSSKKIDLWGGKTALRIIENIF